jgi:deazaflavin-dependent oxidoreductase (nitroreductase family)
VDAVAIDRDLAMQMFRIRWLVRAPIGLYRAGLGWALGRRFVMVEHLGRASGLWRQVVLEVVDRPDETHVVVCSGLGPGSQWFRNIQVNPDVRISTGGLRSVPARARVLSREEAHHHVTRYAAHHPAAYRNLSRLIEPDEGSVEDLPFVEFTPRAESVGDPGELSAGRPAERRDDRGGRP